MSLSQSRLEHDSESVLESKGSGYPSHGGGKADDGPEGDQQQKQQQNDGDQGELEDGHCQAQGPESSKNQKLQHGDKG